MTQIEALAALKAILENDDDPSSAHVRADEVLCKLLVALGFEAVVAEWEKVEKWYE